MTLDTYPPYSGTASPRSHPYASSLSSSASSSTSSVFSDTASQTSNSTVSSGASLENFRPSGTYPELELDPAGLSAFAPISRVSTYPQYQSSACRETARERVLPPLRTELVAPLDQRQHPRRSSTAVNQRPPQLVRQSDRKVNFVDCLVDSATQMVEVIWPTSDPTSRCETASRGVLPLRTFIQETLRRSRTSYSTLQVALYYLILIKAHVPNHDFTMEQPEDVASLRALQCGRRMFLAALILASKYLQDRNYSARAWSKISGLKVCEINTNEMAFLAAVNWKLHITDPIWEKWQEVVLRQTPSNAPPSPGGCIPNTWRAAIPMLTPELETIEVLPKTPVTPVRPTIFHHASSYRSPLSDGSGSQESTPTPSHYRAPRFLEPKPDLLPPTPFLARSGPLPTPALTPQSVASSTPAASAMALGLRRSSMCSAMAQAHSSSMARSCVDQFASSIGTGLEAYHFPSRRPSLAPSASSASSPESMVTDNSRSSRASSISSVSSAGWAPNQANNKLARLATCRNARLPYPALSKCKEQYESASCEPMSSPDFESFHIEDADAMSVKFDSPQSSSPVKASRKRGRSSVDLQNNVRNMLSGSRSMSYLRSTVLPDRSVAQPFSLPGTGPKGLQSPKHMVPERRVPYQQDFGKKRTCCGTESAKIFRREGPGMWAGIL